MHDAATPAVPPAPAGPDVAPPASVRRRALPSGRAVLGGLLVAVAVLGTVALGDDGAGAPTGRVVVAARAVSPGERLGPDDVEALPADLPADIRRSAFADPADLAGAVALAPLAAGDPVTRSGVVLPRDGHDAASPPALEVAVAVDRDRALDGALAVGERIDVVATIGTGETATTAAAVRDALVVAVATGDDALGAAGTVTVTLAVPTRDDALAVARAVDTGSVRLVRTTRAGAGT